MKSLFSYLITIFAVMYWIFRVIVSLMYTLEQEFICTPYNPNFEIAILFLTVICLAFVVKRNLIAATLYFGINVAYFGTIVFNQLTGMQNLNLMDSASMLLTALGVIIPILVFLDVIISKNSGPSQNKKTDWYYTNDKYDREFDERADRNQYKIK